VALQDVLDPAIEAFDHTIGLRVHRRGQAMLDTEVDAEAVEIVVAGGPPAAKSEQTIGELLAVVGEHTGDRHRRGAFQIAQKTAGVGSSLGWVNAHEDPSRGAVDGHEQIPAAALVGHLRQVFHVDMQVARLVGLEGPVCRPWQSRLQGAQVAHAMPAQAAVQPGTRNMRVQELPHHRQQVIQR
jgi:hypothetical protein